MNPRRHFDGMLHETDDPFINFRVLIFGFGLSSGPIESDGTTECFLDPTSCPSEVLM